MKFVCPKCERLVELRDFKVEGATLIISCPTCGNAARVNPSAPAAVALVPLTPVASAAISGERPALQLTSYPGASNVVALRSPGADAVAAAAEAAGSEPFGVPEGRCPKCIAPRQAGAQTCSQCGLAFAQFDPENLAPAQWLATAWVQLLADWGNEQRHVELRARAVAELDLPSVGRLYRVRLATNAEDPFALRGRDEVLRMALMPGVKSESLAGREVDQKWKYVLVAVVLVVSLFVLAAMARTMLAQE